MNNTLIRVNNTLARVNNTLTRVNNTLTRVHNALTLVNNTLARVNNTLTRVNNTLTRQKPEVKYLDCFKIREIPCRKTVEHALCKINGCSETDRCSSLGVAVGPP